MHILCSDLESVFLPEIWIEVAEKTGIEELKLTTRDVADLDLLMQKRLSSLRENEITYNDIQEIIKQSSPYEGAREFLAWAREKMPVVVLSDTFWEFVSPLIEKMDYPTVLCNSLEVDTEGYISNYHIRDDGKRRAVKAFRELGFNVVAMGDSYNDTKMLAEADTGFLFNASENTANDFPQFPAIQNYKELKQQLEEITG